MQSQYQSNVESIPIKLERPTDWSDDDNEEEQEQSSATSVVQFDENFLKNFRIGNMDYKHNIDVGADVQANYSKTDNYCLFHCSQFYNGKRCDTYLANGICEYHWKCLNITFLIMNNLVLDSVDKGTYVSRAELKPVFSTPVGEGTKIMFPLIGSCSNEASIKYLFNVVFKSINPYNQGTAMAQGLYEMIFSQTPRAAVARSSWVNAQAMLFREFDTDSQLLAMNKSEASSIAVDKLFTIFDTPLLLTFPISSKFTEKLNIVGVANISIIFATPVSQVAQVQNNPLGVFCLKGPIIYAPNTKEYKHDYFQSSCYCVTPRLSGMTHSADTRISISNINKSDLACINMNKQVQIFNNDTQ